MPTDARWDPKEPGFEWVVGALDGDGRRHGPYRSWNRDGLLRGTCDYEHGKVHGKNINVHPDGSIASEADWVGGVIMDSVFFRSEAPTTEPFAQAAANVWSVRYYTRDGKTNYTIRYFVRDGTECGPDGKPLPPRPASVSHDARWFPDMDRWVDGEIARGTNTQVGTWRWWSQSGVLRREEVRGADGEATLIAQYEADGALEKKTTLTAAGEERDYYFDSGQLSTRYRDDLQGRQIYKGSWFRDGMLDEESQRTFDGDALASVTERGKAGVLVFEARREGAAMACMLYGEDGETIAATGIIKDDHLEGVWRIFDAPKVERDGLAPTRGDAAVRREVDTAPLAIEHGVTGEGLAWALGEALYRTDEPSLPTPAQLAGVDAEPWAETSGCYDDHVEEFPRLLRALVSDDPLVRRYALGTIDSETEHQGSTYPATARVIPYLARLLSHPRVDRTRLLAMIQVAGEAAAPYVDQVAELHADDDERIGIEGTARAVAAAWPQIFAAFATASPDDRRRILVLAKFAPQARASVAQVARADADPGMRACAVDSLTAMPDYALADAIACLTDRDPLVRAAAAIAIARSKGPESPREVVGGLADAIRNWRDVASRFADLPFTDGHVLAQLAFATGSIGTPDARSLAQLLCAAFDEVDARSALVYGDGLLALALGSGDRPFAKRFVEILDTLARSKQLWVFDVNAHELMAKWGLPRDQAALAALVAKLQASSDPEALAHAAIHAQ